MSSPPYKLRLISFSDVHLGCARVSTPRIIANLDRELCNDAVLRDLDLIVLAGDLYDRLLSMNYKHLPIIDRWIARFLRLCKKHDVVVRILEGTPSHDWKQPHRFLTINEVGEIGADLIYIDELTIRYEERFNMNFLFVPDAIHHDPNVILAQCHELLAAKRLDKVDFAFMHGQFDFQLPEHLMLPKHDSQAYMDIVKYLIFVGHVHTYSYKERIFAQGSFDRTGHGQEEPKGYLRATLYENDTYDVKFVENKEAHQFVTVDCTGLDIDATFQKAIEAAKNADDTAFIRIQADHGNPILRSQDALYLQFPTVVWSTKENKRAKESSFDRLEEKLDYVPVIINRENVSALLHERIQPLGLDAVVMESINRQLAELA